MMVGSFQREQIRRLNMSNIKYMYGDLITNMIKLELIWTCCLNHITNKKGITSLNPLGYYPSLLQRLQLFKELNSPFDML